MSMLSDHQGRRFDSEN